MGRSELGRAVADLVGRERECAVIDAESRYTPIWLETVAQHERPIAGAVAW